MRGSAILAFCIALPLFADAPKVHDPNLVLELVAEAPNIVTPTGIAVDAKGRIWCLENHTHQRGSEYKGPPTDRVRVFDEFDATGKAKRIWTFAEGFKDSMGLTFGTDGSLYIATRANIYRIPIKDDKEVERKVIVKLETKGNYPHNGLCGFAWDRNGDLIFGLGENLGEPYKVIGSDGSTLAGGGEGGSMYRCLPDGSKVSRIATGFWNPFAHCFDVHGNLFMVDNDPDARGPCRLIHVVQGGDYGYRFRYGRKGLHPFGCWNGELPGTLPMVAGTSEAPSGVIACDFTSLPETYSGKLLVTSWGDHTIEAFTLSPRGASFSAVPKVIVRGDENFRPVGFAIAPDGSVVFSDWVDKSYPVHGKGRIWRLSAKKQFSGKPKAPAPPVHANGPPRSMDEMIAKLGDADPFVVSEALEFVERSGTPSQLLAAFRATPLATIVVAMRRSGNLEAKAALPELLAHKDPAIRRAAIQWAAEEKLKEHAPAIRSAGLKPPVTRALLDAWVKANEMLSDRKLPANLPEETDTGIFMELLNDKMPAAVRAMALRMLPPDHKLIHGGYLERFARGDDELAFECVRTAALRTDPRALAALRENLGSPGPIEQRQLAVAGLANFADRDDVQEQLLGYLNHSELAFDALRSLRGVIKKVDSVEKWWNHYRQTLDDPLKVDRDLLEQYQTTLSSCKIGPEVKPLSKDDWKQILGKGEGDAKAGERVFFHSKGPGCYKCHRIDARGGATGPDLTFAGKLMSREKLIESILEPSKEIAPMYTAYRFTMRDGKERTAIFVGETHDSLVTLVDSTGKVDKVRRTDIEERTALRESIMPDNLRAQMTRKEFLDLIAFLMERK